MKILFELGHPAHLHLFKNFIIYLNNTNHFTLATTRKKDALISLIEHYQFNYINVSQSLNSIFGKIYELAERDIKHFLLFFKYKFDCGFGSSESISHLSFLTKFKSYHFDEDDDCVVPLSANIGYPFFTKIINPECLQFSKWKDKRILHSSYHELAYLHPNNFIPDKTILRKYNLKEKQYVIMRLSALKAHHDVGAQGISKETSNKIENIIAKYTVIKSIENEKTHLIEPWDMHHLLNYAKLIISDSQTMTAEAAVLGVPSIRINTFVGKLSYLEELENKYGLTYGFKPENVDEALTKIKEFIDMTNLEEIFQIKREKMLSEKVDLNQWMIDYFEKEINK